MLTRVFTGSEWWRPLVAAAAPAFCCLCCWFALCRRRRRKREREEEAAASKPTWRNDEAELDDLSLDVKVRLPKGTQSA